MRNEGVTLLNKTKYIWLLGFLLVLLTACSPEANKENNHFKDHSLETVVFQKLDSKEGNVTKDDLASIEKLDASDAGIADLEGIESLTALQVLNIKDNEIKDYSPLLKVDTLTEVNIGDTYYTDDMDLAVWSVLESLEKNGVDVQVRPRLSFEEHEGPSEGVFYRVQEGNQTVYLMGSIHIGDQSLYPLHDQINSAFEEADNLAVEIDIVDIDEMEASQIMMQKGMYQDGTILSDVLDKEVFEDAVDQLSSFGMNEAMLNQFQPWVVSMLLSEVALENTDYTGDNGIDLHFLNRAKEKKLPIISLETLESQIESISSSTEEEQTAILENTLDSMDIYHDELKQMINIWRAGKTDVFAQLRQMDQGSEQLAMDERDSAMTDQIEDFLNAKEGETYFVVVGSLHLAGENSIVDLLEKRGYSIEPL